MFSSLSLSLRKEKKGKHNNGGILHVVNVMIYATKMFIAKFEL